jgi:hypothetical protein
VVLDPSTLDVESLIGAGLVTIEAGSTLSVQDTVAVGETIDFTGSSGLLQLGTPSDFDGSIASFAAGDQISIAGTTIASDSFVNNMLTLYAGDGSTLGTLDFAPDTANAADFTPNSQGGVGGAAPCFAAGTRISTEHGELAVEAIAVGDRVRVLLGEGLATVTWVGRREVDCARHDQPNKVWPVRVAAGALGPGRPHTELFLSPDHAVYINEVLIPVRHLVNGSTIVQVPVERVTYHHLELAVHNVLLAQGLPAESFLDMRDGSNCANRPGPTRLYPDYSARMWEAFGCARLIVTGPELEAARASVAYFAMEQAAA